MTREPDPLPGVLPLGARIRGGKDVSGWLLVRCKLDACGDYYTQGSEYGSRHVAVGLIDWNSIAAVPKGGGV